MARSESSSPAWARCWPSALPGCSGAAAHAVDPSGRMTLWSCPGPLENGRQHQDALLLHPTHHRAGLRLAGWSEADRLRVARDGQQRDANLNVKVKLTLAGKQGKAKNVEKTVYYLAGTSPSLTVFRTCSNAEEMPDRSGDQDHWRRADS